MFVGIVKKGSFVLIMCNVDVVRSLPLCYYCDRDGEVGQEWRRPIGMW